MCYQRAEQIPVQSCYGPRAVQVLRRFQCGTMMIVSVGNNESDQVRLDQIQTSLIYIQVTMKQPNPFRGSLIQRKPEEARNPKPCRMPDDEDYLPC